MIGEEQDVVIEERVVLEKFDGDAETDNIVERVHILNGEIVQHDFIEDGEVVESKTFGGEE